VSTAWIISGMSDGAQLLTVEIDHTLALAAKDFFRGYPSVEVRTGDWQHEMDPNPPFDLLFFDANAQEVLAQRQHWDRVVDLLAEGGLIMMDDLAPIEYWPEEWKGMTDHKREFCLFNPRLAGAEVRTSTRTACVVATRLT
jgi:predicted O-methyltransferase YrrM